MDFWLSRFRWYRSACGSEWFFCKAYGAFCPCPQNGFWCRYYCEDFFYYEQYEVSA